jgi:hypothetical protein
VGAAVACKLWALAAIPVALLLLPPAQRARAAVVALGVVVVLYAPYFALDPGAFGDNAKAAGKIGSAPGTVSIANVWFPFANTVDFDAPTGFGADGRVQTARVNGYELPRAVGRLAHLLILLAGTGLALWWLSRGRPAALDGALLVVALALLARCVLDPGTFSYYHAPLLVTLVARDALAKRPPWLSVVALGSFELVARLLPHVSNVHTFNAIYLAWGAGLAALMATVMLRQE